MQKLAAVLASSTLILTACADSTELDVAAEAVIGGTPDVSAYDAVVGLNVKRPDIEGVPQDDAFCTGVLVGDRIVLTAATCVSAPETGEPIALADIELRYGGSGSYSAGTLATIEAVELYRYYVGGAVGTDDLALLLLDAAPGIAPVTVNDSPLSDDPRDVTLVGYGKTQQTGGATGSRNKATIPFNTLGTRTFSAGSLADEKTSCTGDTGAPVFELGTQTLIGISGRHPADGCSEAGARARVDVYAKDFILAYIDRFEGDCPADGTCDTTGCRSVDADCACAWDGATCDTECETRDWDCELGKVLGEACDGSGECENGGRCVAALDDETFTYCSRPCDPAASDCPATMECAAGGATGNECVFLTPSPGSQGFACTAAQQCRSGICEDRICVNECDPGASACDAPYVCGPSDVMPGANVCLGEDLSGGGGFCAVGELGGHSAERRRSRSMLWLLLAGLGLIGLRARRGGASRLG